MMTARIVVQTIGAGGVAADQASEPESMPLPAEPVAQLQTVNVLLAKSDIGLGKTITLELKPEQTSSLAATRQAGTLSQALRSIADLNQVDAGSEDRARQRGNIDVVRYGVTNPTKIQK